MDLAQPDFGRFAAALQLEEADRLPLAEVMVDYSIRSQFLRKPVVADDLVTQIEFWCLAGYDYIPMSVGMMQPGKVTQNSQISQAIQRTFHTDQSETDVENMESAKEKPYSR